MDNRNLIEISEKILEESDMSLVEASPADEKKAGEVVRELVKTKWSGSNKEQMKAVQLLKGLAVNDSEVANKFMKMLDGAATKYGSSL